jgi:ornithine carbamoyltransferase
MDAGSTQLGRGETVADTARVLSRYVDRSTRSLDVSARRERSTGSLDGIARRDRPT